MATVHEVAQYNRNHVDWVKFFSVVDTLGKTMNGQKDRFDKSDIIEMALDAYSDSNILYVNDDGVDHLLLNLNNAHGLPTTQEMKFVGTLFYKEFVVERANRRKGPQCAALRAYHYICGCVCAALNALHKMYSNVGKCGWGVHPLSGWG